MENKLIVDTADIAEDVDFDEDLAPEEDMVATTGPSAEDDKIEFHVQMRSHTMRDMEDLVVEAAARQIVGRRQDTEIARRIEARCIELIDSKLTTALDTVTAEIIDQPVTPKFGDKQPVTMRELIGLYGREYLETLVDPQGKRHDGWSRGVRRIEHLAEKSLERKFTSEIERATNAAVTALQAEIRAHHKTLIEAEKARFRAALDKEVAPPKS